MSFALRNVEDKYVTIEHWSIEPCAFQKSEALGIEGWVKQADIGAKCQQLPTNCKASSNTTSCTCSASTKNSEQDNFHI